MWGTQNENYLFLLSSSAFEKMKCCLLLETWNRCHPLWVSSYFNLFYPCASPAPDVASPGLGPLTSSQSMFGLGHLIWSLAINATFRLTTPKFIFSALTSPLNSCHFYSSAYWTPSLPSLILIYILMCPKPNSSFSPPLSIFSIQ